MHQIDVASFVVQDGDFVPVGNFRPPLANKAYVEGALELVVDGVVISRKDYHDLIDQLWAYIVQGLEDLREGRRFETYWPDQPIKLTMTPLPNNSVLVERSGAPDPDVRVVVDLFELVDALLPNAIAFFDAFATFGATWEPTDVLRSLRDLERWRARHR